MKYWELGKNGFIMHYMVSGPEIKEYHTTERMKNQLKLEAKLRKDIAEEKAPVIKEEAALFKCAGLSLPFRMDYNHGSEFVDHSGFYSTLMHVRMQAAVNVYVKEDLTVPAALWTYMSVGVYVNGVLAAEQKHPVYKPIAKTEFLVNLKKGKNQLFFACENLGVRDSRNIFGFQFLSDTEKICTGLAEGELQERLYENAAFFDNMTLRGEEVCFPKAVPDGMIFRYPRQSPDYEEMKLSPEEEAVDPSENKKKIKEPYFRAEVVYDTKECRFSRTFDVAKRHKPQYGPEGISKEENFQLILKRISEVQSENRDEFGFSMTNILSRKYLNCVDKKDRDRLLETLDLIEKRVDCADFILVGLLRYIHVYGLEDPELHARTKEVLLDFRYWMNMEGADAMCFWSENHSLMFYECAREAGKLYPDEYFKRAGMTGKELECYAEKKVYDWLLDVETYGFEEFLSTVYMCVTFAVLLSVVDFGTEEMKKKAVKITDHLLWMLSVHTYKGCVTAPMGRVYGEVLYPFEQGAQSLMNLLNAKVPYSYGEGWIAYMVGSSYSLPYEYSRLMDEEICTTYTTGNARIKLEKRDDFCLTSVCSPREASYVRWENIQNTEKGNEDTHDANKSMNECFHGTSAFGPGVYGYQQHLWYAALDGEAVIFANHPSSGSTHTGNRPGYWYGNGVMPAIRQEEGMLGVIYEISEDYPIHYTHVYCPQIRFEEIQKEKHYLFLKKKKGYLALWCSLCLEEYEDCLEKCEYRAYGKSHAYVVFCGSETKDASFEDFISRVKNTPVSYSSETKCLEAGDEKEFLIYQKQEDKTQYVE